MVTIVRGLERFVFSYLKQTVGQSFFESAARSLFCSLERRHDRLVYLGALPPPPDQSIFISAPILVALASRVLVPNKGSSSLNESTGA